MTMYATQNLGNLYDGYGKEKANSLLGNLGTKFFCQNGEFETNEWASKASGRKSSSASRKPTETPNRLR